MRISPRHIKYKGHRQLADARRTGRIVLGAVSVVAGLLLAVVLVFGASVAAMLWQANRMIDAANNLANTALGCGGSGDISKDSRHLVEATRQLRDELDQPQWTFLRDHTSYGSDITAARTTLDAVGELVDGPFTDMMDLAHRLSGFSLQDKTVDMSALMDMPGIVRTARSDIHTQLKRLKKLERPSIGKVAQLVDTGISGLQTVDDMLDGYDELIDLVPQLLGANGERTYLVAVQNPAELRSAGGMVGTYTAITADQGMVEIGDFDTTGGWQNPDAPFDEANAQEAAIYGAQVYRWPQTTTVNPNFPRAAVTFKNLWQMQPGNEGTQVDGVLMVDPVFLQSMVEATGAVTLDDGKVLDGSNTLRFFERDLYIEHPKFKDQNEYVSKAAKAIMNHVLSGVNASNASNLLKALRQTTESAHFKLWMAQQPEFDALVQTGLIDASAAGALPNDPSKPVAGIYLTEAHASKLDWYLQTDMTVTRTCDGNLNAWNRRLTDQLDAPTRSTALAAVPTSSLGEEYTVVFTVRNTLTEQQVKDLPGFVTGTAAEEIAEGYKAGEMGLRLVLTAPAGGAITSIAYDHAELVANGMLDEHQILNVRLRNLPAGEQETIAFTVRTAAGVSSLLDVTTTPIINETGIHTGSDGAVTDACTGQPAKPPADGQSGAQGDAQTPADGQGTADSGAAADPNAQGDAAQGGTSGEAAQGGGSTGGSSPADALGSLSTLKDQLSCPVDIRKLL